MRKRYTADFETCTWLKDETYVWAYAINGIEDIDYFEFGNNIDSFFKWCEEQKDAILYFHHLKFDGEFIIYYLLENDFKFIKDRKEKEDHTFTTLITEDGMFYQIEIYFRVGSKKDIKVTIYDSLKIIPFKVEKIAKAFGLPISKLEIDYNKYRERNHKLTKQEINYIRNDVKIVAMALKTLFDEDLKKMTQAANAMSNYKKLFGLSRFEHFYPMLDKEVDKFCRKSYKGRIYIS